jgi:ACS family pantothenate transporter-like MFS transporter
MGMHILTAGPARFGTQTGLTQTSNLILTPVPAYIRIPFLEVGWTVFTFNLAGSKTYHQMLALRFAVRLFEAGSWPALYYILGNWYRKLELGKRNGILQSAVSIATFVSRLL